MQRGDVIILAAYREVKVCGRMASLYRSQRRRGVAQPGRAPGSGPGGRRFKSSLPDQSFQTLKQHFWFSVYIDGVEIVDGAVFLDFPLGFHRELQSDILQELCLHRDCSSRLTADQPLRGEDPDKY